MFQIAQKGVKHMVKVCLHVNTKEISDLTSECTQSRYVYVVECLFEDTIGQICWLGPDHVCTLVE